MARASDVLGPPPRADLEFGTIAGMLERNAELRPDATAVVDGDRRLSFADLATAVSDSCRAAMAAGIEVGDRFSVWAPNSLEWVVSAFGAISAGGVLVPLSTRFQAREAAHIVGRTRPKVLFTVSDFLGRDHVGMLRSRLAPVDMPGTVVVMSGEVPDGCIAWDDHLVGGEVVTEATARARAESLRSDDVSDIFFTSGTTGQPKGVLATHAQVLRANALFMWSVGVVEGDRVLCVNPLFHGFGYKAALLGSLALGASSYLEPVFDATRVLQLIERERLTVVPAPPTVFSDLIDHPDRERFDLGSLHRAFTGATNVPPALITRILDVLGFATVTTAYGQTEATTLAFTTIEDDPADITVWAGRAIDGVELRIVDDDGVEVPRGTPGEIVGRGFIVMKGYFEDEAGTRDAIDADGWLHTGDIGVMDERGFVRVADRKKDMFIVGGLNVYPAEVENLLSHHDDIAAIAVIGVPDDRLGEVGVAYVVPRRGASLDPEQVQEWSRREVANYKVPRHVRIVDSLPVNASGKVLKTELRELWATEEGDR
jgi:acyl-CoA synthetase (AMP-forming)/AMP-acid ligase II